MISHNIQEKSQSDNTRLEQNLKALKAKVDSNTTMQEGSEASIAELKSKFSGN